MRRILSTLLLLAVATQAEAAITFTANTSPVNNPERGWTRRLPTAKKFIASTTMCADATSMVNTATGTGSGPTKVMYDRFQISSGVMTSTEKTKFSQNLRALRDCGKGVKAIFRPIIDNATGETMAHMLSMMDDLSAAITGTCTAAGNTQCTNGGGSCTDNNDCNYCDVIDKWELGLSGANGEWHGGPPAGVCESQNGIPGSTYDPLYSGCPSTCQTGACTNTVGTVTCSVDADCVGADTQRIYDYAFDKICPTGNTTRHICFRNARLRNIPKYEKTAAQLLALAYTGADMGRFCFYDDGLYGGRYDGATLRCNEFPTNEDWVNKTSLWGSTTGEPTNVGLGPGTCQTGPCNDPNGADCNPPGTCTSGVNQGGSGQCEDYHDITRALKHARRMHNDTVNDGFGLDGTGTLWAPATEFVADLRAQSGAFNAFTNVLGPHYVLGTSTMPGGNLHKGTGYTFKFDLSNDGSANLRNYRKAYICFENCGATACSTEQCQPLITDPRRWDAGATTFVSETVVIPAALAGTGTFDVDLWMPDGAVTLQTPKAPLASQAAYSWQMANLKGDPGGANFDVWDASNGWNKLGTVTVDASMPPACSSNADCLPSDSNPCTTDVCLNPGLANAVCSNTNNTADCTTFDGAYCNGTDTCSSGSCSNHTGNPCTGATPICQESDDTCHSAGGTTVELWHPLALTFTDSVQTYTDTTTSPNVFADRRITAKMTGPDVDCGTVADCLGQATTCTASGQCTYQVDGYWNGDNAFAASGGKVTTFPANSGSKFVVKFMPMYEGSWAYDVKFCSGTDAFNSNSATCSGFSDITSRLTEATTGTFAVIPSQIVDSKDFRYQSNGLVTNRANANSGEGSHYLSFAGNNPGYIVLNGIGIPEGIFNYKGFDNTKFITTPTRKCATGSVPAVKDFSAHVTDWNSGDPNWVCGTGASADSTGQSQTSCTITDKTNAGKGLIGLINFVSERDANAIYIIVNSTTDGDTSSMFPFVDGDNNPTSTRRIYDISKLAQWDIAFSHMDVKGVCPFFIYGESEISGEMNDSAKTCTNNATQCLGSDRLLMYHEMAARFGHHPCMMLMSDEEGGFTQPSNAQIVQALKKWNPYDHPVTVSPPGGGSANVDSVFLDTTNGVALHHAPGSRQVWDKDIDYTGLQTSFTVYTTGAYQECFGGGGRPGWRTQSDSDGVRWICGIVEPQGCDHDDLTESNTSMNVCRKGRQWPAMLGGFGIWLNYLRQHDVSVATDLHVWDLCIDDLNDPGTKEAIVWDGIINNFMNAAGRDLSQAVASDSEAYVTDSASDHFMPQMAVVGNFILAYQDDLDNATVKTTALTNGQTYAVTWTDPLTGTTYPCDAGSCTNGTITDAGSDINIGHCSGCTVDEALTVELSDVTTTTTSTTSTTDIDVTTTTTTTLPDAPANSPVLDTSNVACTTDGSRSQLVLDITVGDRPNRMLAVFATLKRTVTTTPGINGTQATFDGVAMTAVDNQVSAPGSGIPAMQQTALLLPAPTVGLHQLVVTFDATNMAEHSVVAGVFYNTDQSVSLSSDHDTGLGSDWLTSGTKYVNAPLSSGTPPTSTVLVNNLSFHSNGGDAHPTPGNDFAWLDTARCGTVDTGLTSGVSYSYHGDVAVHVDDSWTRATLNGAPGAWAFMTLALGGDVPTSTTSTTVTTITTTTSTVTSTTTGSDCTDGNPASCGGDCPANQECITDTWECVCRTVGSNGPGYKMRGTTTKGVNAK